MLEMRLGLALGRSQGEVRKIPYPEFRRWRAFYMIEPWGWWNEESNFARLIAMVHNSRAAIRKFALERHRSSFEMLEVWLISKQRPKG